jgi:hypothetical protein
MLKSAGKLKDGNIHVSPDFTMLQRQRRKKIFDEFYNRKENGEIDIFLRYVNGMPSIRKSRDSNNNHKNSSQGSVPGQGGSEN